jgi:hypothetical protein
MQHATNGRWTGNSAQQPHLSVAELGLRCMAAGSAVSGAAAGPAFGGDNFAADTPPRLSPNGTGGRQPNGEIPWLSGHKELYAMATLICSARSDADLPPR